MSASANAALYLFIYCRCIHRQNIKLEVKMSVIYYSFNQLITCGTEMEE